ncbi:MAG: hypothetical protein PHF37_08530 [Phycisphaerae bacterium]|nr:hypothetical protein [Phycisphaerae bacterium]
MDEEKKRKVMVAVIVGCLLTAAGIFYFTNIRGSGVGGGSRGPIYFLCVNEKCKHQFEMSSNDYAEKMREIGPEAMMMGQTPTECPKCNEQSAYIAEKCLACGTYFVPDYMNNTDYPDRCPSCGHSDIEDQVKQNPQE